MTNSVFALAQGLFQDLEEGLTSLSELRTLVDDVHSELAAARVTRLRARHPNLAEGEPWAPLRLRLEQAAREGFDTYCALVRRPAGGIVFTAHPTFALPPGLRAAIGRQVSGEGTEDAGTLSRSVAEDACSWPRPVTLEDEHGEVQAALHHAAQAQAAYAELVYRVAQDFFAERWCEVRPSLPTLASWVGYDLDGRTDISWARSIAFRIGEKARQLAYYQDRLADIANRYRVAVLERVAERLSEARCETLLQADLFSVDVSDPNALVAAANNLVEHTQARLTDVAEIIATLDEICSESEDDDLALEVRVLCEQVRNLQLGTAHVHVRVNASQITAGISQELNLEADDRLRGRLTMSALSRKAAEVVPVEVGFGDLFLEQSTARRQFMICAQILKHIDAGSPIRFLIAESEEPATVMAALYLARYYGVEHGLDISPLFETPEALETGGRFIERLLDEPEFQRYLQKRGRLSIQLGFSDSGRFIGQVAANMAVERIHNLILRALADRLPGIELLIFNTHGESLGRGCWPGETGRRFDHLLSSWTRANAETFGVGLIHEVSFQGGDGYLHFSGSALAHSTLSAWCLHVLKDPDTGSGEDAYYLQTDLVWDFYRGLRRWQERLFANADYNRLLSEFSPGLITSSGSRLNRRPDASAVRGIRGLRAIPHNAQLQQMAIPVNTACGVGSALSRETDGLVELVNSSRRMKDLISVALSGRLLTSLPALRGYGHVFNPDTWIAHARAASAHSSESASAYRNVYASLRSGETSLCVSRTANLLSTDLDRFDTLLSRLDQAPSSARRHESRVLLHAMHGIRQALMMHAFALAGRLPRISGRHGTDLRGIMNLILSLRIREGAELLARIFPAAHDDVSVLSGLVETGSARAAPTDYDHIHDKIISPIIEIEGLLNRISLALNHPYDAFG